MVAFVADAQRNEVPVLTTSGVAAQVWRDPARQVSLSRLLRGVDERSVDPQVSRRIGALLRAAGTSDIVDASVVDISSDGDEVLTSDPDDIAVLATAAHRRLSIIAI